MFLQDSVGFLIDLMPNNEAIALIKSLLLIKDDKT